MDRPESGQRVAVVQDNPYEPPQAPLVGGQSAVFAAKPGVWTWYVVYCVCMAVMYLLVMVFGIVLGVMGANSGDMGDAEAVVMAVLIGGIGFVLFIPYAIAPLLPRKPWTWILGLVLIGLGLTSCATLPFAVPLLIYWLKPELQVYLGRKTAMK